MDEPAPLATFTIAYEDGASLRNVDFTGEGTLAVHAHEPACRFTGRRRGLAGKTETIAIRSDDIWNVAHAGSRVQFSTRMGKSGARGHPFVFICRNAADATEVIRRLPNAPDPDFSTRVDFGRRLARLPAARSPWTSVTNIIIALNAAVFIAMGLLGAGWLFPASMDPYVLYVANNAGATTDGEWWRVLTSMFVHYGLLHLALNMWALHQTGSFVEKLFGRPLFAVCYLGSGLVASFTSLLWHGDQVWSAGASGAVFGVYGMLLGFMLREKQSIPAPVLKPMMRSTLTFAGYNLVYGMILPQIDNAAHIGGLLGGVALGWLVALPLDPAARPPLQPGRLRLGIAAIATAVALGATLAPRYDYHFREELHWHDLIEADTTAESELLAREDHHFQSYRNDPRADALAGWISADAIPFYEQWRARAAALPLTPGKLTAQRRGTLTELIDARLAAYRQLEEGLRGDDPSGAFQRHADRDPPILAPARQR